MGERSATPSRAQVRLLLDLLVTAQSRYDHALLVGDDIGERHRMLAEFQDALEAVLRAVDALEAAGGRP